MLLVFGFVGTLVSLERAVALRRAAGFAAPALLGLGGAADLARPAGSARVLDGARRDRAGRRLRPVVAAAARRRGARPGLRRGAGGRGRSARGSAGAPSRCCCPGWSASSCSPSRGERLELARLAMGPPSRGDPRAGSRPRSVAVVGHPALAGRRRTRCSAASARAGRLARGARRARRTVRATGLTRFMAGCMLAGYLWLGGRRRRWLLGGAAYDGARYDAVVHAVFLGLHDVDDHGARPVILPAVLRRPLPYPPCCWAPRRPAARSLLHCGCGSATPSGSSSAWRPAACSTSPRCCCSSALAVWSSVAAPPGDQGAGTARRAASGRCATCRRALAGPAVAVGLAHPFVPAPRWLMIHLLLLGAVTHAILVWSQHFADALLHSPVRPDDRRRPVERACSSSTPACSRWWSACCRAVAGDRGRGRCRSRPRCSGTGVAGRPAAPVAAGQVRRHRALLRRRRGCLPVGAGLGAAGSRPRRPAGTRG